MSLADDVDGPRLAAASIAAADLPPALDPATHERLLTLMTYVGNALHQPVAFAGQAPGASHESWVLHVGDQPGPKVLVRLEPHEGPFLNYDHKREATLLRLLRDRDFPVPQVLSVGASDLVGSPFLVLEWIEGEVLNPRSASEMPQADRRARAGAMASMLARLHATPVPPAAEPAPAAQAEPRDTGPQDSGPSDTGTSDTEPRDTGTDGLEAIFDEFGRALSQLRVVNSLVLDFVRVWLVRHAPERNRQRSLVHGDFRLGNLVWRDGQIVGILDWETARIGDPLFDIAWMCMGATNGSDLVMGLVTRDDFVEMYAAMSGRDIAQLDLVYWQVVAAWVRGCTEARLLDISITSHTPHDRDARDMSWEFASARTERELFELIDCYEGSG